MAGNTVWTLKDFSRLNVVAIRPMRRPLVTFTGEYTHTNAYNLALLSDLAYTDAPVVQKFFEQAAENGGRSFTFSKPKMKNSPLFDEDEIKNKFVFSNDSFHNDPVTDTQFYIVHNAAQVILSVRGTSSFQDGIQDAKATQVDFKEGKGQVHLGFYEGFKFLKPKLDAYIDKYKCSPKEFIITGHSLGAAIATLVAAYLREKITSKVMLYTYGSPRVGNKTFFNYFTYTKTFTYYRIVNGSDIVTMVPMPGIDLKPYLLPLGGGAPHLLPLVLLDLDGDLFTHLGKVKHIQALTNGGIVEDDNANAAKFAKLLLGPVIMAGEITLYAILGIKEAAENHSLSQYVGILNRMLKLVVNSYLDIHSNEYDNLEADIKTLEKEVSDLERSESNLLGQAASHDRLSLSESDPYMKGWHAAEAAKLRLQAAGLRVIIADKNVDLAHYRGAVRYYKDRAANKERYLTELIGSGFYKSSMEAEFSYHASH